MILIKILPIFCIILIHFSLINGQSFRPKESLETFIPLFRSFRKGLFQFIGRTSENERNLQLARRLNKLQNEIPPNVPFPCNVTGFRSLKRPSSVHKLRPGDIDVVGALGDSLTAGFGLVATNPLHVFMENRGLSWSIGGQGTWRQYLTLPNILKEFNPNLVGYSLRDSFSDSRASQFNPAEGAAISSELPYMAKVLITRITKDRRVNLKKDWKLITIMIGANDFCLDICFQKNLTLALESHKKDMIQVLRMLRDSLPRTIVNFVSPPHLKIIVDTRNVPNFCKFIRRIECYCLFSENSVNKREMYYKFMELWQQLDEEISQIPEFHQNDFEVVFQPSVGGVKVPNESSNQTDYTFLSTDCFHLSQKFNARAANALWNNMLQKVGSKTLGFDPLFEKFLCPTEKSPYIFTNVNS